MLYVLTFCGGALVGSSLMAVIAASRDDEM